MGAGREHGPGRRSAREWANLVAAWKRSGLTAKEFASSHQLSANSLSWWAWRLRRPVARRTSPPAGLRLARVDVVGPVPGESENAESMRARWELATSRGTLRVHGPLDDELLAAVLEMLVARNGRRGQR